MAIGNVWAVFRFEWRRAFTWGRMAWWAILTLFPIFIVGLVRIAAREPMPREFGTAFLFALIPMLISMLGTFLWTTPAISAELERESWVYLAVRPGGRTAVLLGKYLAAITWVVPAALVSLTLCVPLAGIGQPVKSWLTLAAMSCLSIPAYGAVYLTIGTLFIKRAMVVAVAYSLIFELIVSNVPALINKLTVQYRLRALLVKWADIPIDVTLRRSVWTKELLGNEPAGWHVAVLLAYTVALVVAALVIVRRREFELAKTADL